MTVAQRYSVEHRFCLLTGILPAPVFVAQVGSVERRVWLLDSILLSAVFGRSTE